MYRVVRVKKMIFACIAAVLAVAIGLSAYLKADSAWPYAERQTEDGETETYIKWVDFTPTCEVMQQALKYDIDTYEAEVHLNWIELLAYAAAKSGGKFQHKQSKYIDEVAERLKAGEAIEAITESLEYFNYYLEAYTAVLAEYVGPYSIELPSDEDPDVLVWKDTYGLKAFSPLAEGYAFSHSDDFGNGRSYGFRRKHLGHDMFGRVGTPVIAVEGGKIEVMAWNRYGGWRVGIRSLDGKRYYYYAHLRKDHPYNKSLKEGDIVNPGEVIGYLGMTGYSVKENVNNMQKPHLHFGIQLIFDESQKEGAAELWIDAYEIVKLLQKNRATVVKDEETKDYSRKYRAKYPGRDETSSESGND